MPVVAGTDGIPGFNLQRELELYVKAGMRPAEALRTATWNAATYARVLDDRGSIAPGKRADLVVLDRDPFATDPALIKDIKVCATVLGGRCFDGASQT